MSRPLKHRCSASRMTISQHGFSIIHVLIALALVLVFFTDLPGHMKVISSSKVRHEANAFANTLWYAKTQAANLGVRVTLCKSPDQQHCVSRGRWDDGWILFVDASDKSDFDPDKDRLLKTRAGHEMSVPMFGAGRAKHAISFTPKGELSGSAGNARSGYVVLCPDGQLDRQSTAIRLKASGDIAVVNALDIKGVKCKA